MQHPTSNFQLPRRLVLATVVLAVVGLVAAEVQVRLEAQNRQVPIFEPDPLWSQALPNRWATGAVGGIAVDSHDNVWVFHRPGTIPESERGASLNPPASECCIPAPSVLEFSPDGRLLQAWGKPGPGYEWFKTEHGILIDDKDNVWLSGSAKEDNQILKFTRDGKFLMQIGHAGKNTGSNDPENVGGPAGLFLYKKANELFVADGYFNHRVVVFDAETGKFKRAWGAYGKKPDDSYKFPPRAQLIAGDPPPQFNNPVHAVLVSNDDLVYVADRTNNRLQIFKVDGTFVKEVFVARNTLQQEGTVYNFVFSPDKEQRFLYVMDGSNKAIRVYDRKSMEQVESIGGHAGHNAREFFHPHSFAVDSKGNLFIGEVNDGMRYYRYAFKGMKAASSTELLTSDHYVQVKSTVPAMEGQQAQLYVRERVSAGGAAASGDNVVLFVHGAGTPAEVAFDVPYQDYSWMAFLAQAGFDVFSVDMTGYGRSTRPAPMTDPCNLSKEQQAGIVKAPCAPGYPHTLTSMVSDWDDVGAAVDYIRALRHVDRVSLVAWSRGGPRAGGYAAQHPEKVKRLVVLAPAYDRMTRADAATRTLGDGVPMNKQSHQDFIANWDRQVGCGNQYESAAAEAIWTDMLASDPVGATWGPGVRRAPETVGSWTPDMAKRLTVPFLMVSGAHDKQVAPDRVRELYADAGSPQKVFVDLACSSHNAMWERNHLVLFNASLEWLKSGTVNGAKSGMLKLGYGLSTATR